MTINSKRIQQRISKDLPKIPQNSLRILQKILQNIQFPALHLEAKNPFGLVSAFISEKQWVGPEIQLTYISLLLESLECDFFRESEETLLVLVVSKKAMWLDKKQTMKHLNFYTQAQRHSFDFFWKELVRFLQLLSWKMF